VAGYLAAQVDAGADALMLFDTWGGLLSADAFRRFSLEPIREVLAALGGRVPTIVFSKGSGARLEALADCGASCVALDWTVDLAAARAAIGVRVAIQGNLDPVVLTTDAVTVDREARAVVRAAGPTPGYVFNLGHGIVPATPPGLVGVLVDAVHAESRAKKSAR
jgi:uroporphyrinogen decarboxylase